MGIVNKATMTIRCPECGYENRDMYRFCGMCGATLRREAPAEGTALEPPSPKLESPKAAQDLPQPPESPVDVPLPSFLTGEPAPRNLDYLLEDDAPKSHGKLVITLLLLVLAAGLMAWHWRRDGYPWASSRSSTPPTTATSTSSPPPAATPSQPAPTPDDTAPAQTAKPSTPEPQPAVAPAPPTEPPPQATANETPQQIESKPDNAAPSSAKPASNAATDNSSPDESQPAPAVAKPVPPPAAKLKPEAKPAVPTAPTLTGDDKLVADGEKYLYGNGVPENCELAEKNLRTAAGHSNARALTLMGAMYATGHCVTRDLPTAYRWFAKALHQDPSNGRVQQDLEILWKQMTPEEKQLATKGGG
jgi:hypothetical protein